MPPFASLGIVGLGLMGGSLARAVRRVTPEVQIVAVDADADALMRARRSGVVDDTLAPADLSQLPQRAELIVLATPLHSYPSLLKLLAPTLSAWNVISDVGSVKEQPSIAAVEALPFPDRFVPAHPIAGSEKSGFDASTAELFSHRRVILTPLARTDPDALHRMESFWQGLSAHTHSMSPRDHDYFYARVSHLVHLLSFAFYAALRDHSPAVLEASFLHRYLRLARSDVRMWGDITLWNARLIDEALLELRTLLLEPRSLRAQYGIWEHQAHRIMPVVEPDASFLRFAFTPNASPLCYTLCALASSLVELVSGDMITAAGPAFHDVTRPLLSVTLLPKDEEAWKFSHTLMQRTLSHLALLQLALRHRDARAIDSWFAKSLWQE